MAVVSDISGRLSVNLDALTTVVNNLKSLQGDFDKTLQTVQEEVESLSDFWAGSNHERLVAYFDERCQAVRLRTEALAAMCEAMTSALSQYSMLEYNLRLAAKADKMSANSTGNRTFTIDGEGHIGW